MTSLLVDERYEGLLGEACKATPDTWALCDSKWKNIESEVIAVQTIHAAQNNLRDHGEAFSWCGQNVFRGFSCAGGVDNARGLRLLGTDILLVPYTGTAVPPDSVARNKDGQPFVLFPTKNLLCYVVSHARQMRERRTA